jgi:hypothetical protein
MLIASTKHYRTLERRYIIHTQELLRKGFDLPLKGKNSVIVKGNGIELPNQKWVLGKANRKMIADKRILYLIGIAKAKGRKN